MEPAEKFLKSEDDRREFLRTCGRFAVTVPPTVGILLSTSMASPAIAASTGGGGGSGGGGSQDPGPGGSHDPGPGVGQDPGPGGGRDPGPGGGLGHAPVSGAPPKLPELGGKGRGH